MSKQSRIEQLHKLLARVEQRRAEPRLVAVAGLGAAPSARSENTNLAAKAPPVRAVPTEPLDSFDEAFADLTGPSSMPPPPPTPPVAAHDAASVSSLPAPASALRHLSEPPPRSPTEVLPATPAARIAPSPTQPFDSAVRVTSSPRIDAPKTFGELLELSLSLRAKP